MSKNNDILESLGRRDGMTVPDGFFADFNRRMASALPERPELSAPQPLPRTFWQKVRPYVYMAAMFAGVWCMLKMFTMISGVGPQPLESNAVLADAFTDEAFVNQYVVDQLSQWEIYNDIYDEGIDPQALFADSLYADSIAL